MSYLDDASLVMIPSGYKDGKLYSVKPSDGAGDFTFTRGSNLAATRVDENGLIEKGRENLLLRSNSFDNSYWTKTNATLTSGQSGVYGSNDAFKVDFVGGTVSSVQRNQTFSIGVGTLSFYLKAGTHNYIQILNSPSGAHYANFDISNGVTGNKGPSIIDSSITDVGNGWYRCSMTADFSTQAIYFVWPVNSLTSGWADVVSTSGNYYIQDAQLEVGLVATDYIETTTTTAQAGILEDMPRLDYSGGTCPALLLEPQRTNLVTNSEYFNNYTLYGSPTITPNDIESPEGLINGVKVQRGSNATPIRIQSITTLGTQYTMSIYAKAGSHNQINIDIGDEFNATFNLTSEWQRFDVTSTPSVYTHIDITIPNSVSGDYIYIYGLQLEEASYPTSYIPTYGSSVTRSADSCSKTSISSLIGQTEGTLFVELDNADDIDKPEITLDDGTNNNRLLLTRAISTGNWALFTASGGISGATNSSVSTNSGKFAIAYNATNYVVYKDGVEILTRTASLPVSLNAIRLNGRATSDLYSNKSIKQALVFPTRLSNTELAALTTL